MKEKEKNQKDAQDFMGAVNEKYYNGNLTEDILKKTIGTLQEAFDKGVKEIACHIGPNGTAAIEYGNMAEYKEYEPAMLVKRGQDQCIYIYDGRD